MRRSRWATLVGMAPLAVLGASSGAQFDAREWVGVASASETRQDPSAEDGLANDRARDDETLAHALAIACAPVRDELDLGVVFGREYVVAPPERERRELGCGLIAIWYQIGAYGFGLWLQALLFDPGDGTAPLVVRRFLRYEAGAERIPSVRAMVREFAGARALVREQARGGSVDVSSEAAMNASQAALRIALGSAPADAPPQALAATFEALADPFARLTTGPDCSVFLTRQSAPGLVEQLVDAGRFDLIRRVLRGANPEARAVAALSLRQHALLSKRATIGFDRSDADVVQHLCELDLRLDYCTSDVSYTRRLSDLLSGR